MDVNFPPTYSALPLAVNARTTGVVPPEGPKPSGSQETPFYLRNRLENFPPAYTVPSSVI
jgi:hypothetical protein